MDAILQTPILYRQVALFLAGIALGGLVNWAAYRWAWRPRAISPWSSPHPDHPRRWWDRLPLVGWLGLRRESGLHGRGFWIRPLAVELLLGLGLVLLYWWEIEQGGLLPREFPRPLAPAVLAILHAQFAAHAVLVCFMLAASLIDLDEKTIPDAITLPGTLVGLLLAVVLPTAALPDVYSVAMPNVAGGPQVMILEGLQIASPQPWPQWLEPRDADAHLQSDPLLWAIAAFWLWCFALMPRSWYPQHGVGRALALMLARLRRQRSTAYLAGMALLGAVAITSVWYVCSRLPPASFPVFAGVWIPRASAWTALLSALTGVVAGGAIIWLVRIVGSVTLRREAMGFGDVTLMAMIGAYVGWQPCLVIFFLSPLAALVLGVVQLVFSRDPEIPYGPFLCLGTLMVLVAWPPIWDWAGNIFALGWIVPAGMLVCMAVMGLMLAGYQRLRS